MAKHLTWSHPAPSTLVPMNHYQLAPSYPATSQKQVVHGKKKQRLDMTELK